MNVRIMRLLSMNTSSGAPNETNNEECYAQGQIQLSYCRIIIHHAPYLEVLTRSCLEVMVGQSG